MVAVTNLGLHAFNFLPVPADHAFTDGPDTTIAIPSSLCLTASAPGISLQAVNTTFFPTLYT